MGTRSLTYVYDFDKPVVCMYRHFDGYPSAHGQELAEFLFDGKLVNGIPLDAKGKLFNGMGCLTAQAIAHFKEGAGGYYLHRGGTTNCGEEYRYEVIFNDNTKELLFKIIEIGYTNDKGNYVNKPRVLFFGSPKEFLQSELVNS